MNWRSQSPDGKIDNDNDIVVKNKESNSKILEAREKGLYINS